MEIGSIIRSRRAARGFTQEQVAQALGVTATAVSKWERNASLPEITLLPALARLLGTDLNDLLAFQQEMTRAERGAWPLPSPWQRSSGSSSPGAACWR